MIGGIGDASLDARYRHMRRYSHNVEILKKRFEKLGIDYACGYIAARYNWRYNVPAWIKFKEFFWIPEDIAAARAVLEDAGIDPWSCGNDLVQAGIGIEQK